MALNSLIEAYADRALNQAQIEPLDEGGFVGHVPGLRGVVAFGGSENATREELRSVVEDWVNFQVNRGVRVPVIGGIDLNGDVPAPL